MDAESPSRRVRRCVVYGCRLRGEGTVSPLDGGLGAARRPVEGLCLLWTVLDGGAGRTLSPLAGTRGPRDVERQGRRPVSLRSNWGCAAFPGGQTAKNDIFDHDSDPKNLIFDHSDPKKSIFWALPGAIFGDF